MRLLELRSKMLEEGWIELKGQNVLGFVSPCGEKFRCYEYDTGDFYNFGTIWAMRATEAANE